MKVRIMLAALTGVAALAAIAAPANSRPRFRDSLPGELDPNVNPYGPGHYELNGFHVYAGPNCYVSREQVLVNGRLVWKPLATCHSDSAR